jgi:hypothetical protein
MQKISSSSKSKLKLIFDISTSLILPSLEDISIIFPLSNLRKHHQNIGLNIGISPSVSINPDKKISSINELLYCSISFILYT